jgi:hypothetical protein
LPCAMRTAKILRTATAAVSTRQRTLHGTGLFSRSVGSNNVSYTCVPLLECISWKMIIIKISSNLKMGFTSWVNSLYFDGFYFTCIDFGDDNP